MGTGVAGIGPLTDMVWGQNVPVPRTYAFAPGNAVAPLPAGPGYSPLATLPPGSSATYGPGTGYATGASGSGASGGGMGWLGNMNWRTAAILAGVFIVAVLGLKYVHWDA